MRLLCCCFVPCGRTYIFFAMAKGTNNECYDVSLRWRIPLWIPAKIDGWLYENYRRPLTRVPRVFYISHFLKGYFTRGVLWYTYGNTLTTPIVLGNAFYINKDLSRHNRFVFSSIMVRANKPIKTFSYH